MTKLNMDCFYLIFYQMDRISLHSCLLVNREWCKIIAPILCKKYSYCEHGERLKKLINTILSCLPSSSKQLLSNNGIKLPSTILLKLPLSCNYINFCKPPSLFMKRILAVVFKETFGPEYNKEKIDTWDHKRNLLEQEIYKLFFSNCDNIKKLQWRTSQPLTLFPGAPACFSQLDSLEVDVEFVDSTALCEIAQVCKDLNKLTIKGCYQDVSGLTSLINAQRNLKSVEI